MLKNSSFAQAFWRRFARLARYRPPPLLIAVILLLATIFLISGGVYLIFMPKEVIAPYYGGLVAIYRGIHNQALAESIAVMLIYILGAVGLMLIYRSARHRHNPNQAYMMIVIGMMLLVIALTLIEAALFYKIRV